METNIASSGNGREGSDFMGPIMELQANLAAWGSDQGKSGAERGGQGAPVGKDPRVAFRDGLPKDPAFAAVQGHVDMPFHDAPAPNGFASHFAIDQDPFPALPGNGLGNRRVGMGENVNGQSICF
jgi:hypothetical protein